MKKIIHVILFLYLTVFSNGCGININEKKNCIPKVNFESTKSVKMHLIKVVDESFSFSDLKIGEDEQYVCLSTPNILSCDDSFGKLKVTELPTGTILRLTGNAKRVEPFGFSTAFKNDMIYMQGKINNITVWIPMFELNLFTEYKKESELNLKGLETIGVNNANILTTLKCFD